MSEIQLINFDTELTAADSARRIISGKIAPYGEVGHTSAGATIFAANSIRTDGEISKIPLRLEHDKKQPIGRMISLDVTDLGLFASFKVSNSSKGSDALIEASEGIRAGLSVGIEVVDSKRDRSGNLVVTDSILRETSLVSSAAFHSAEVKSVAASQGEQEVPIDKPTTKESEAEVSDQAATTEAPKEAAPSVEASRPTIAAPVITAGGATTTPRLAPITSGAYLKHSLIVAGKGEGFEDSVRALAAYDDQSKKALSAALDSSGNWITAADDTSSTNTGLTLPLHLQKFITNTFDGRRPAIDAITKAPLVETGLSFTIPRLVTAPTIATTAENVAVSETGMTSDYITVSVVKKAGKNRVSFEMFDRSSPMFYDLLMTELNKAYAKDTDNYALTALAGGTAGTVVAATAAGLQSFIAVESAAAYKGTGGDFAKNLVASTDQWAAIMGYADTTGRPLYFAQGATYNAGGNVTTDSLVGNVLSTNLYVDHNITTAGLIDDSMFLVAPDSVMYWESPVTQLRLNVLATGQIDVELYGYAAVQVLKTAGVRRFNV